MEFCRFRQYGPQNRSHSEHRKAEIRPAKSIRREKNAFLSAPSGKARRKTGPGGGETGAFPCEAPARNAPPPTRKPAAGDGPADFRAAVTHSAGGGETGFRGSDERSRTMLRGLSARPLPGMIPEPGELPGSLRPPPKKGVRDDIGRGQPVPEIAPFRRACGKSGAAGTADSEIHYICPSIAYSCGPACIRRRRDVTPKTERP